MSDASTLIEELAFRESDGMSVSLLWVRGTDRVCVAVRDGRCGQRFDLNVRPTENAMDVFNHPYAYAESELAVRPSSQDWIC
jgi:hypothetical protein